MERLGMRREAHFREHLCVKGGWDEEIIYGILEQEWRGPLPIPTPTGGFVRVPPSQDISSRKPEPRPVSESSIGWAVRSGELP